MSDEYVRCARDNCRVGFFFFVGGDKVCFEHLLAKLICNIVCVRKCVFIKLLTQMVNKHLIVTNKRLKLKSKVKKIKNTTINENEWVRVSWQM